MKIVCDDKIPYIQAALHELADEVVVKPGRDITPDDVRDAPWHKGRDLANRLDLAEASGVETFRALLNFAQRRDSAEQLVIDGAEEI